MKRLFHAALLSVAGLVALPAAAADVGVSISVGQPGFYGTIDLGSHARPQVVYEAPIVINAPHGHRAPPAYLHVPPGHMKKWANYCGHYNACNRPVYFVTDNWYNNVYAPKVRHQGPKSKPHDHRPPHGKPHHDRGPDRHPGKPHHGPHNGPGGHGPHR